MKCILVLEEGLEPEEKRDFNGNYFLYHLLGAENVIVVPNGADLMEEMHKVAKEVSEKEYTICNSSWWIKPYGRYGIRCLCARNYGAII